MSDYRRGSYEKLYELRVTQLDGSITGMGGLSPQRASEYMKYAKEKGLKVELIDEAAKARVVWAKA